MGGARVRWYNLAGNTRLRRAVSPIRLTAGITSVVLVASIPALTVPAVAAPAGRAVTTSASSDAVIDHTTAARRAAASGEQVEVTGERTEYTTWAVLTTRTSRYPSAVAISTRSTPSSTSG
ncbi:hypothetical protein [Streptomyces parvulus]|uniref:hypothetical protein n=1 Tax=Streptomyces parvulus TaxID=146923 RepID=UPI00343251BA